MTVADRESEVARKFALLAPVLDERQRRLWMAVEAREAGHGGITVVARDRGRAFHGDAGCRRTRQRRSRFRADTPCRGGPQAGGDGESGVDCGVGAPGRPEHSGGSGVAAALRGSYRPRWSNRAMRPASGWYGGCCTRPATACRRPPSSSRAPSTGTATPSSATSTTGCASIKRPGSR